MSKRPTKEELEACIATQWPVIESLWPVNFVIEAVIVASQDHEAFDSKDDAAVTMLDPDSRTAKTYINHDHRIWNENPWQATCFALLGHERGHIEEDDIASTFSAKDGDKLRRLTEMAAIRVERILKWAWKEIYGKKSDKGES